ncbi:Cof-type HAD-IIB family hydrolase [Streptococcus hillyeri]|uniref:HAD family hydrolase n=1 Tax=Streptococcus hillyeri TaxID=2282420 RepID=A0A3L9DQG7_9STRE|nr:Cof-type HAD-IIB family hydrolase [Streptococcus hillyeri]RLY02438.1 HAD family hydrolase [Streptococcus hillyeri]
MIKLIATDMDGTFLSGHNSYNEQRFEAVFEELKKREIPLVIATGNNMKRLRDLFPKHANQLTFIAENGAQLVHKGREVFSLFMDKEEQEPLLRFLEERFPDAQHFLSAGEVTYVLETLPTEQKAFLSQFFTSIEELSHLHQASQVPLYRISIQFEDNFEQNFAEIENYLIGTSFRVVETGFNWLDILPKTVHKAVGLDYLMTEWQLSPAEVMVFGDSPNDLEMLERFEYSYAMANATDAVKAVANFLAPSHTEDGVLQVLENVLKEM